MASRADSWATQQLVEFLASVSAYSDEQSAVRGGIEAVATAMEAEVAVLVADDRVQAAIGYPRGGLPEDELVAASRRATGFLEVKGLGACRSASVALDSGGGRLLIARHAAEPLTDEERDLLRGMGRVLGMALDGIRLLDSLHERQELLERLSHVQRSIARRTDLQEVLDSIAAGARELLGDEVVALRLIVEGDPGALELVSSLGMDSSLITRTRRVPADHGIVGTAFREDRIVACDDHAHAADDVRELAEAGLTAAMAAPIHERGEAVGCVAVGTRRPDRTYSESEQEALLAFAEHAGLALNDTHAAAETVHQAFHDSLTGLANRAQFLDQLDQAVARTKRSSNGVVVLFADLDGFKTVNDSLGHAAGDELLVLVGERIKRGLRPSDLAARFGGDEFAVMLENANHSVGQTVAERILKMFEEPFGVRGREVYLTMSIGVAEGRDEADQLVRNADLAMYQSKSSGKGRATLFEPGMHAAVVERLELEVDMKVAIEREELVLHYQPVCSLATGEIRGFEALVRWRHPTRGLIAPDTFIPLAEETRHIVPLGKWVLEEACRQIAEWRERFQHLPSLEMSVNLSGIQLEQPELLEHVRVALGRAGLDPAALVLEITETALMADTAANAQAFRSLKDLGVQLAVDDFGTGYSSLEYLQRFPIDVLKVAKSFVDGLAAQDGGGALVQAIVDLAESFGLKVIAEGIEQPEQRARLLTLGCELGQGFYFARPSGAEATEALLERGTPLGSGAPDARKLMLD